MSRFWSVDSVPYPVSVRLRHLLKCLVPFERRFEANAVQIFEAEEMKMGRMVQEMKKIGSIAGPMIISMMMVGHLGSQLILSATALAFSCCSVFGFNVLLGMAGALETLCGQAYGAEQYQKLGIYTYTAIISLALVSLPLSLIWIFMGKLLPLMHQDPSISQAAGKFSRCFIPALFGYAVFQPLVRFFQTQSLIMPLLISSVLTFCIHIPICWLLVFKSSLGYLGAAFALDISIWLNILFLGLFMRYSVACAKTRATVSMEVLMEIPRVLRLAVPSTLMLCLTTTGTVYAIPYAIGAAASTRVSNELGAGNPQGAQVAVQGAILMAFADAVLFSSALLAGRRFFGLMFSKNKQVVEYFTTMSPFVATTVALDAFQGVLTGIARGCGWQKLGTYINIGAYYLIGIPISVVLGFVLHLKGKGLWSGILVGAALQNIGLSILTTYMDWGKQAMKAKARTCDGLEMECQSSEVVI
ncbi:DETOXIFICATION 10-like protein [Drosera capensis]